MAAPYDGQDPIVPNAYIAGKGFWIVPNVAEDSEDRDAANFGIGVEGVIDRTNWLAWRMVNGLEGGSYPGNITWTGAATFTGVTSFTNDSNTFKKIRVLETSVLDGNVTLGAGLTVAGGSTFNGTVGFADPVVAADTMQHLGDGAYRVLRKKTGLDALSTIEPWKADLWIVPPLTANRTWGLAIPPGNAICEATIMLTTTVGGFQLTLNTVGALATVATLGTGNKLCVVVMFNGTDWIVKSSNSV